MNKIEKIIKEFDELFNEERNEQEEMEIENEKIMQIYKYGTKCLADAIKVYHNFKKERIKLFQKHWNEFKENYFHSLEELLQFRRLNEGSGIVYDEEIDLIAKCFLFSCYYVDYYDNDVSYLEKCLTEEKEYWIDFKNRIEEIRDMNSYDILDSKDNYVDDIFDDNFRYWNMKNIEMENRWVNRSNQYNDDESYSKVMRRCDNEEKRDIINANLAKYIRMKKRESGQIEIF